ncbi:hypothetical protein N865_19970 [Intrasporangium oryzae NRRL B-24470]|uniref:Uncharacterized protein n=1 Tax=Intrasporangium oryzae NRRL B-24470 TaxID=1386089 RepID=W9G1B4_9MICO|nr:AAA family ATPase [Intrasporangium oryzae]EWS99885.1 hypothetical protein N865_19970 [Intrasporangium oryzae NRRL B-24470]
MLLEHLEDAPEHDRFRIEQVMPSESNTLIVAQRKAGKTTVCLNLARSLLLGVPFLDAFPVQQATGTVAFINLELSPAMLRSWASGMGIPGNRLVTVNARGLGNPLETQQRRSQLADQLREYQVEAVIVDPFSVAFPGEDANNSTEVRRWLSDIEEMARGDLGISDLIITAHAGWNADRRARGASALEDWPDSIIRLGLAGNSRTFSATGRDVSVQETSMGFDHRTRVLRLTRESPTRLGSTPSIDPHIVEVVRSSPGISTSAIGAAMRTRGVNFRNGDENRALRRLVEAGVLRVTIGSKGSKLYHPVD